MLESIATTSQDRRRFLSEARATPRLLSGTTINSSTVTSESSTWYSSTSRTVSGGLKFHCWRTISRKEVPPPEDQRKTNFCVLAVSFSSKTSDICFSLCGWSKISRIVCAPAMAARQPCASPEAKADSTGKFLVFRSNFDNGCSLNVQPAFTTGSNCPLRRSNQPFAHTQLSLPPDRLLAIDH